MTTTQDFINTLPNNPDWAVRAVEILVGAAIKSSASDLHILCQKDRLVARGRRDGGLFQIAELPLERRDLLIGRLKALAGLAAFIRNEPQDGRIEWPEEVLGEARSSKTRNSAAAAKSGPARLLRISFLPTINGQNVVVRFPESTAEELALDALGMPAEVYSGVCGLLSRQEGTILLTGPSSSGKTTTMYAMLRRLNATHGDRLNFVTIEDPVECNLGFAAQVQVNEAQELTFGRALRAALRQDPNVLMIGEIRDEETAITAIQAGMTGHLVISTLHAGRAARVFTRLLSMGIPSYLVASALSGAVAQRLARVLCAKCRRPAPSEVGGFMAAGCDECAGTGYQRRAGLFELVLVTEHLRELILARSTVDQIASEAAHSQVGDLTKKARSLFEIGAISRAELEFLSAGTAD
ncbi:MAG: ATPase, T2SS/T4P/T4SS family [Candidatus Sumerlaeota bacterium]|nr:ATPase, T2SS/T4P/T4SS family [Candidatus Sumerlaeota bacterium]